MVATTTSEGSIAPENPRRSLTRGRRSTFYLVTSLIIAAVVLLGFEHNYFLRPLFNGRPDPAYVVSLAVMIAWHTSLVLIGQSAIGLRAAAFIVSRL